MLASAPQLRLGAASVWMGSCAAGSQAICIPQRNIRGQRRVRTNSAADAQDDTASTTAGDLMKDLDALLEDLASGQPPVQQQASSAAPLAQPPPGWEVRCDVNGCSIVRVQKESSAPGLQGPSVSKSRSSGEPRDFELAEGNGWKLGYDKAPPNPDEFSAVLGGPSWTIELSQKEYADFIKLLHNLRRSVATLQICGDWASGNNENDDATLELSTEHIWMQGRAPQRRLSLLQELWKRGINNSKPPEAAFSLRFIVLTPGQREVEGHWSAEAVMDVLQHLDEQRGESPLKSSRDSFAKEASYA